MVPYLLANFVLLVVALEVTLSFAMPFNERPRRFAYDSATGYGWTPDLDVMRSGGQRVRTGALATVAPVHSVGRTVDVLLCGDSMLAGEVASWPSGCGEIASADLRASLPQTTLINLGVPGYGTDQSWIRYGQFAHLRPRLVVFLMHQNDLWDNVTSFHHMRHKPRFELQNGVLTQVSWPTPWDRLVDHSWVAALIRTRKAMVRAPSSGDDRVRLATAIVRAWANEVEASGAKFIVAAHHNPLRPAPDDFSQLARDLEAAGIRTLVLNRELPNFEETGIPDGVHWDTAGHERVGHYLGKLLVKELSR